MRKTSFVSSLLLSFFVISGCVEAIPDPDLEEFLFESPEKGVIDYSTREYDSVLNDDGFYHDNPRCQGVQNVIKRVDQFLNATWIPAQTIPMYPEGYYSSGVEYKGIPYSFGAESDGTVGLDISLDTFLSAISNPYSFVYTTDIRKPPYTEILAGPYYGVVCSSAVAFFLGADFPYVTYLLDSSPWFVKLPQQDPNQIRVGDVIWKSNHVMLVYDIARDAENSIVRVGIVEGNSPLTRQFTISFEEFIRRWKEDSYVVYCYTDIAKTQYTPSQYAPIRDESVNCFISDICTARGDRVCFREGTPVILNTITTPDSDVSLYREGVLVGVYQVKNHLLLLDGLEYGAYIAYKGLNPSSIDYTSFSVVDYDVQLERVNSRLLRVKYHSDNSRPSYVALCNSQYRYISVFPISEEALYRGSIIIPISDSDAFVRVFFDSEYGRISSSIQQIPS